MAASMAKKQNTLAFFETALKPIIVQFFEMVPIRRIKWEADNISPQNIDLDTQIEVLNRTLRSDLCKKFPPALSYRKAFVKKLLNVLEDYGVEICDEIYEVYSELLQHQEAGEDTLCYKTYTLDCASCTSITLQESVNMVSFGTTGLSTWQAAQHLSEWIVQNQDLFVDKNILELGSGLGLSGLVACKICRIKSYTFTDLHKQVLELLANNIHRNLGQSTTNTDKNVSSRNPNTKTSMVKEISELNNFDELTKKCFQDGYKLGSSENKDFQMLNICDIPSPFGDANSVDRLDRGQSASEGDDLLNLCCDQWERHASFNTYLYKGSGRICLAQLDWENIDEQLMDHLNDTDIVLAADVVYDNRIIPHLVQTIKKILVSNISRKDPVCAYLASTIRNEDTRDQFLINLSSNGLNYQQIPGPKLQIFHYDKSVPIEVLKMTVTDF